MYFLLKVWAFSRNFGQSKFSWMFFCFVLTNKLYTSVWSPTIKGFSHFRNEEDVLYLQCLEYLGFYEYAVNELQIFNVYMITVMSVYIYSYFDFSTGLLFVASLLGLCRYDDIEIIRVCIQSLWILGYVHIHYMCHAFLFKFEFL